MWTFFGSFILTLTVCLICAYLLCGRYSADERQCLASQEKPERREVRTRVVNDVKPAFTFPPHFKAESPGDDITVPVPQDLDADDEWSA
jgi:hypothetical protein